MLFRSPMTIQKEIRLPVRGFEQETDHVHNKAIKMSSSEKEEYIKTLRKDMQEAARKLDFETAATLRDIILELKAED